MKLFLDANIFVAACGSDNGGSRYLFRIAEKESDICLFSSEYALFEARENILKKMPGSMTLFFQLTSLSIVTLIHPAPNHLQFLARSVVPLKDAPILAGALSARVDALCTLDKKDFHNAEVKELCASFGTTVVFPRDILVQWRNDHM
jgi:predicted nucleic acid-binding protein